MPETLLTASEESTKVVLCASTVSAQRSLGENIRFNILVQRCDLASFSGMGKLGDEKGRTKTREARSQADWTHVSFQ